MTLFAAIGIFAVGLVLLLVGAEVLVRGAASLAKRLHITEITIGLTVVAFGTSSPELIVNVLASAQGKSEIVFGNVIGSNLANILIILGISALLQPIVVLKNTVWKEIPFSLLAALAVLVLCNDILVFGGAADVLSRIDGLILLALFAGFLAYVYRLSKVQPVGELDVKLYAPWLTTIFIVVGLAMLFLGGKFVVDGAVVIARSAGISEKFIAVTIVAIGTSLPELATSAVAAWRGRCDIAVGNIVGSNVFNLLLVLGVSSVIRPAAYLASFNVDLYVLLGVTLALMWAILAGQKHRISRLQGGLFLLGYAAYVAYLLLRE